MLCVTIVCLYLLFLPPPSLSIDVDAAADVAVYGYVDDDQIFSTELPGKHSPLLDHFNIAHYLLSYACIRNCCCYCLSYSDA